MTTDFLTINDPSSAQNAFIERARREHRGALISALRSAGHIPADLYNRDMMAVLLWFASGRHEWLKAHPKYEISCQGETRWPK